MAQRKGLGKGLGALLPQKPLATEPPRFIPIESLKPNPSQPRKAFNEDLLNELASSIKEHGVVQPLLVKQEETGYMIIAGERRWRASQMAGLKELPIHVFKGDDKSIVEVALVENIQREDLSPLEVANTLKELMEQLGLTQEEVGQKVGWSRSAVANKTRLLNLPEQIQAKLREQSISEGHARALLAVENEGIMCSLAEDCAHKNWSVRELEQRINEMSSSESRPKKRGNTPDWSLDLARKFGVSIATTGRGRKMKLSISGLNKKQIEKLGEVLQREQDELFPRK